MKCPDSIEELQDLEKMIPLCKVTLYEQAKARIESGTAKSVSEAARQIGDETGRKPASIERSIRRQQETGSRTLSELSGTAKHIPKFTESDKKLIVKAARGIKNEIKKEKKEKEEIAKKTAQHEIKTELKKDVSGVCDLRVCSCEKLFSSGIMPDAVITDPPYPREFLPLFTELALGCKEAKVPLVAVMVGQSYLPEIINRLCEHLSYRWTLAYMTPGGQSVQQWAAKVNAFWKPILLFGAADQWIGDVASSNVNDNDKRFHEWGQSESGIADIVERLTKPNQLICDPFLGGGTTAVVSLSLGRRFVGCDIDPKSVETTKIRISSCLLGELSGLDGETPN